MIKLTQNISATGNTLVIGGCGCGKTSHFLIPNILEQESTFIAASESSELYAQTADAMKKKGFEVIALCPEMAAKNVKDEDLRRINIFEGVSDYSGIAEKLVKDACAMGFQWDERHANILKFFFKKTYSDCGKLNFDILTGVIEKFDFGPYLNLAFILTNFYDLKLIDAAERLRAEMLMVFKKNNVNLYAKYAPVVRMMDPTDTKKYAVYIITDTFGSNPDFVPNTLEEFFVKRESFCDKYTEDVKKNFNKIPLFIDGLGNAGKFSDALLDYIKNADSERMTAIITVQAIGQIISLYGGETGGFVDAMENILWMGSMDKSSIDFISGYSGEYVLSAETGKCLVVRHQEKAVWDDFIPIAQI